MTPFVPGQRWFSTAEPELGLGTVLRVAGRGVQIVFTGSGLLRQYAIGSAPLVRAEFRPGDRVLVGGTPVDIEAVSNEDGILHYAAGGRRIAEGELDAEQPVSQADQRLLAGRVDRNDQYEFRVRALARRAAARAHPGFGVLGARMDLVPHQLRVAELAASRRPPRLLLADEVGLGKTIEACLVLAQLLASGRAGRALVLVPESLVHQWFVELKRRSNLAFSVFDEERCEAIELNDPGTNPFEDEQLVIAATRWLAGDDKRAKQLYAAGWDALVVDEAHHLAWSPEAPSAEYALVEQLAARTPAVILLTATPEQLGLDGHFARLRLLDPDRYSDLGQFREESARLLHLSRIVDALGRGASLSASDTEALAAMLGEEAAQLPEQLGRIASGDEAARERLVDALIDRHGTGRVMVRNRRATVGGFPRRIAHGERLPDPGTDPTLQGRLLAEFLADVDPAQHAEPEHDYARDPRTDWLLGLLDALAPQKVLLICRSRAKVQALEEALRLRSGLQVARFHEDMNLLQRDRNAAFFAQPDGARLLLSSEIGAEGRNFQFAQHLVLWDLPADPDQLEQRIGRLDRIGQRGDVHIHVAALEGSPQDAQLAWYEDGLDAFQRVCPDGRELLRRFGAELVEIATQGDRERLAELVTRTRAAHAELSEAIAAGRDHLLELASQRGARQGRLLEAMRAHDAEVTAESESEDAFALALLEQFGVHHDPLGGGVWLLDPEYVTLDAFEDLKDGPRQATFDRDRALARDDLLFLREDHPLVQGALELLLSAENGNAAFLLDEALPPRTVLLQAVYVLECVAERQLQVDRFLPPLPIAVTIDTRLAVRPDFTPSDSARRRAADRQLDLVRYRKILGKLVPPMLKRAGTEAAEQAAASIAAARAAARNWAEGELDRLRALRRINPAVREDEIQRLEAEAVARDAAIPQARPRLDAIRLVASPDFLALRG